MTIAEAVEKLSGRGLATMPTPGRRLQTRADCGPHRPAQWTWLPPDPSRPILAPAEHERAFVEVMRGCSSGVVELRYRHPDDPLRLRKADIEGLSRENLDPLKSELVFGDSRFPAVLVPIQKRDGNWWPLAQVGAWIRRANSATTLQEILVALEAACAGGEIAARGKRRVYAISRALPISHFDPNFVWFSDRNSTLEPWPEQITPEEWPDLTFFARPRPAAGEQYSAAVEQDLDQSDILVELRSKSLCRLTWADIEFSPGDVMAKWPTSEFSRSSVPDPAQPSSDSLRGPAATRERAATRRRGPKPGTVDRYGDSDRALYPELEQLIRDEHLSRTAAAMKLAAADRIGGAGSEENRARRLARRFAGERGTQN